MRRLSVFALLLACLLALSACAGGEGAEEAPPPQDGGEEDVTLYDCGALQIALPSEYQPLLYVETEFPDAEESWKPLISVYERASYDASKADFGEAGGFLFGLLQMDQAAFEQSISADGSGSDVFATDGERYYVYTYPTDVQFYRSGEEIRTDSEDWKTWEDLNELGPQVRKDFLTRNGLQTFSVQDLVSQPFTLDETHVCLRYYTYARKDGDTRIYDHLLLSQPARQGSGGIWAVERWMDEYGGQYLYFPDSGLPAAEYYAQLQAECDAGAHPELRTPAGAAAAFVEDCFGHETGEDSFEKVSELDWNYMESNQRLQQMALDLMAGRETDPMALLDCVGSAPADSWGVLGRMLYGSDWLSPLLEALSDAAVGQDQEARDRAVMAFYLSAREAEASFLTSAADLLQLQRQADPEACRSALAAFPEEQQAILEDAAGVSPTD